MFAWYKEGPQISGAEDLDKQICSSRSRFNLNLGLF